MGKIKHHKILSFVLISLFTLAIVGLVVSYAFDVYFVEKYIDKDKRIGEHVETRITLFQEQMLYLSLFFGLVGVLLWVFKRKLLRFLHAHPEMLTNLILLLILLLVLCLAGEIVMRIFFSEIIYKEYAHGPGAIKYLKQIESNSFGYRDIEHDFIKNENTYRILFLGDSFTRGSGIENLEDTYPKLIQNELNEKYDSDVETIILAKSGYSTLDELNALKNTGLNFNPDFIVVGYFVNDAEGKGSRIGYENMFYSHYTLPYEVGSFLYGHSFFYYFLESRLKNIIISFGFGKNNIDYTKHLYSDSNPNFQQHKKDLEELISISNKNGVPLLIVMIPSLEVKLEAYPYTYTHSFIKNMSESNGAYYLDLLTYFRKYGPDELRVSFMDAHMSELGHKIASDAIIGYLQENSLLN